MMLLVKCSPALFLSFRRALFIVYFTGVRYFWNSSLLPLQLAESFHWRSLDVKFFDVLSLAPSNRQTQRAAASRFLTFSHALHPPQNNPFSVLDPLFSNTKILARQTFRPRGITFIIHRHLVPKRIMTLAIRILKILSFM